MQRRHLCQVLYIACLPRGDACIAPHASAKFSLQLPTRCSLSSHVQMTALDQSKQQNALLATIAEQHPILTSGLSGDALLRALLKPRSSVDHMRLCDPALPWKACKLCLKHACLLLGLL